MAPICLEKCIPVPPVINLGAEVFHILVRQSLIIRLAVQPQPPVLRLKQKLQIIVCRPVFGRYYIFRGEVVMPHKVRGQPEPRFLEFFPAVGIGFFVRCVERRLYPWDPAGESRLRQVSQVFPVSE
jgi:hypothetical protein